MEKENCKKKNCRLIDPDLSSLLNVAFSGLAAISGIYAIYIQIESDNKDKVDEDERFEIALRGVSRALKDVKQSLRLFHIQINHLESLLKRVNLRGHKKEDIFKLPVKYGRISVYFYPFEIEVYSNIHEGIFESIRNYSIKLISVAEFLSVYANDMACEQRILIKSELENIVDSLNKVQSQEMNLGQFIQMLRNTSWYIDKVVNKIADTYGTMF